MRERRTELVRIDSRGEAHPIGTVASQRLRERAGTFRLLPSPRHVVFLRYTGEDGRRDAEDGAIVRLAGEITTPGALADVVALVGQAGLRGELCVATGDSERSVFFDQGKSSAPSPTWKRSASVRSCTASVRSTRRPATRRSPA